MTVLIIIITLTIAAIYKDWIKENFEIFLIWAQEHPISSPFVFIAASFVFVLAIGNMSFMATTVGFALNNAYSMQIFAILIGTASVFVGCWLAG